MEKIISIHARLADVTDNRKAMLNFIFNASSDIFANHRLEIVISDATFKIGKSEYNRRRAIGLNRDTCGPPHLSDIPLAEGSVQVIFRSTVHNHPLSSERPILLPIRLGAEKMRDNAFVPSSHPWSKDRQSRKGRTDIRKEQSVSILEVRDTVTRIK